MKVGVKDDLHGVLQLTNWDSSNHLISGRQTKAGLPEDAASAIFILPRPELRLYWPQN